MAHLNWNQRRKITKMEEAAANYQRLANDCANVADERQRTGSRGTASQYRELADSYRQRRQQTKAEIADRRANPDKYRW